MKAAIIGFGELGKQLYAYINEQYSPTKTVFFDDHYKGENSFPFFGFRSTDFNDFSFFVGLGYKQLKTKQKILEELIEMKRDLPNLIHPTCFVSNHSVINMACYLYPMCNIDKGVSLMLGTLLNNSVIVSHDSTIGACSYLSPGVTVSGNVNIGERVFVGSSSVVSNNLKIGNDSVIGLASSISKDVPINSCVIGNPMQIVSKINLQ